MAERHTRKVKERYTGLLPVTFEEASSDRELKKLLPDPWEGRKYLAVLYEDGQPAGIKELTPGGSVEELKRQANEVFGL